MKKSIIIISLLFINISLFTQNNLNLTAKITSVTVYSSSADIRYKKDVSLKKGKNIIIFSDLTPFIVNNSINVSFSDKSVNIVTVTEKINYLKVSKQAISTQFKDSIKVNTEKIQLIDYKIETINREKELLFKDKGIGGVANGVSVVEIEKASQFFDKRFNELNNKLFNLTKQRNKLSKINNNLKLQINQVSTVKSKSISEIIIVANSPSNKKVTVNFNFLTNNAGWAPLYDIKYYGPDKDLDFVFRANVFNASNTNWNNVKIVLSTASPTVGFAIPSLNDNNQKNNNQINYNNQSIKFKTIQTNNAITKYKIKHSYSIPSDGKPYLVEVDKFKMPSSFSYMLIPKLDNNGFLMANIPNWNKYSIISGTTNIYNNGTFLGKTFLNTNTENDTLEVFLGKDNKIEAYRKEDNISHPRNIIGNYVVDKTNIFFTIKNNYNKEVKIKLIDQVPVFIEYEKIKMTISNIENAIYNKDDGSIIWTFNLNAKANIKREFGYNIKAPKENSEIVRQKKMKFRSISCPSF